MPLQPRVSSDNAEVTTQHLKRTSRLTLAHQLSCVPCLCHRECSGRVTTGRTGRRGTRPRDRGLSGVTCGLYEGIREFDKAADHFFKTFVVKTSAFWIPKQPSSHSASQFT